MLKRSLDVTEFAGGKRYERRWKIKEILFLGLTVVHENGA